MSDPLYEVHRQAQAEFQSYDQLQIVSTFGEPQAEYAAIRKSTGLMDLPQRGLLELTGRDRLQFLNNILTAELWNKQTRQALAPGRWVYSFLLNLKGRIVADMNILELGDRTLIELDTRLAHEVKLLLEAYVISEQVNIGNRLGHLHEIALFGPKASDLLNMPLLAPQTCHVINRFSCDIVAWRDDPTGPQGIHLILPTESVRSVWMKLITEMMLRPVGWAAFNTARIEAGRPILGIDIETAPIASAMPLKQQRESDDASGSTLGMLPAESAQLDRAVSLTKCYIGQEIVARMHSRGQVARRIVAIRMEGDELPISGAEILDQNSTHIGTVSSSTNSPVLSNLAICLGIVKRPFFEVGSKLSIPAEGKLRSGTVVQPPFVPLG